MIGNQKVIVVLPAYNAARTLERTYRAVDRTVVDAVILVDDGSSDDTAAIAKHLGITVYQHPKNRGYGANQKTCYQLALKQGADIIVMLHPDDQYPPQSVCALAELVAEGRCDVALGSRLLDGGAIRRGMPRYKYFCNRLWTIGQNACLRQRLSEYHTGFRAFSRRFLNSVPLLENSDDFLFDNQILIQAVHFGYPIAELSTPARFTPESSSITPWRGVWYGLGVIAVTAQYHLHRLGLVRVRIFRPTGGRLSEGGEGFRQLQPQLPI